MKVTLHCERCPDCFGKGAHQRRGEGRTCPNYTVDEHDRFVVEADLNDRQITTLKWLALRRGADADRYYGPSYIFNQAFPNQPHRGRRDAGMTRTLDKLQRYGLVEADYRGYVGAGSSGRDWRISTEGLRLVTLGYV